MSEAFESIKQGLSEAIDHAADRPIGAVEHPPQAVDVESIRKSVRMGRAEFASSVGVTVGTVRHWERGERVPRGPALVLLNLIAREPTAFLGALSRRGHG